MNWAKIMKTITDDLEGFFAQGGWTFLEADSEGEGDAEGADDSDVEEDDYDPEEDDSAEEGNGQYDRLKILCIGIFQDRKVIIQLKKMMKISMMKTVVQVSEREIYSFIEKNLIQYSMM